MREQKRERERERDREREGERERERGREGEGGRGIERARGGEESKVGLLVSTFFEVVQLEQIICSAFVVLNFGNKNTFAQI